MRNKIAFLLMAIALIFLAINFMAPRFANKATKVIAYKPDTIPTTQKPGYCWTSAISVARDDAWRCMQDNEIHDPCFASSQAGIMVCDADPSKNQAGFALKLTKPLPTQEKVQVSGENVWLMQLADGSICQPYTGTMPIIPEKDGVKAIKYGCTNVNAAKDAPAIGILDGSVKVGRQWTAQEIMYRDSPAGPKIETIREVNIVEVWR